MTYFFVDLDGTENASNITPKRTKEGFWTVEFRIDLADKHFTYDALTELPKGTIEKLFGRKLTYLDDPIRVV